MAGTGRGLGGKSAREGLLSILPVLAILLLVRAYPLAVTVVKSFTNWDGLYANDWVGIANYLRIFAGRDFWTVLTNNFLILLNMPLQILLGLLVAVLLYERVPGWRVHRSIFYFPQVISPVIVGFLFNILFSFNGPINLALRGLGLEFFAREWLADRFSGIGVIVACLVWINIGWQAILFLSGMSSLSPEILDAARLDGASYLQRTFRLFLPMIIPVIEYSAIITVIWSFTAIFPFIFSLTNGGPGYQTSTLDYLVYLKVFVTGGRMGEACALSMVLLLIMLGFSRVQMRISRGYEGWRD